MQRIFKPLTFILLLFFVLWSCKKNAQNPRLDQLIVRGLWKINKAKLSGSGMAVLTDSCIRDNTLALSPTDGRLPIGFLDQGPTKCDSSDVQLETFHWNVDNEKKLFYPSIFLFPGHTNTTCEILTLTENLLVVSTEMLANGSVQGVIVTYTH